MGIEVSNLAKVKQNNTFLISKLIFLGVICGSALLIILLIEDLADLSFRRADDEVRENFLNASEKMTEASQPEQVLSLLLQHEFRTSDPLPEVTEKNAARIAAQISVCLQGSCRIFGFNTNGLMVFPKDNPPDREEREKLWQGGWDYNTCESLPKRFQAASSRIKALERCSEKRFGNHASLLFSADFSMYKWRKTKADNKTVFITRMFKTNQKIEESTDLFASGFQIEIDEEQLPVSALNQRCLELKPPDISYAAIFSNNKCVAKSGSQKPWFDEMAPAIQDKTEGYENTNDGFFFRQRLPGPHNRVLILAAPPPFTVSVTKESRQLVEALFLILALSLGAWASKFAFGKAPLNIGFRWQIAIALICSSVLPVTALIYFSFNRMLEVKRIDQMKLKNRLLETVRQVDREYKNYLESNQVLFSNIAKDLGNGISSQKISHKPIKNSEIRKTEGILLLDAARQNDFIYIPAGKKGKKQNDKLINLLKTLIRDFLDQILEARGELRTTSETPKKKGFSFSIQDLFKEKNILTDMLSNLGRISFSTWISKDVGFYSDLIEDSSGKILGFLFIMLKNMETSSYEFVQRKLSAAHDSNGVFTRATSISERNPAGRQFTGISLLCFGEEQKETSPAQFRPYPELLAMANRTRLSRSIEMGEFLVGSQKYLILTAPMQYLQKYVLGAAVLQENLYRGPEKILLPLKVLLLLGFLIGVCTILLIAKTVINPIRRLKTAANDISSGSFSTFLPVDGNDELGELAGSFNEMAVEIHRAERLRRFVSDSVWNEIHTESGPAKSALTPVTPDVRSVEAAILCSDIRSFTTLSEKYPPEIIVSSLNDYFTLMDRVIKKFGGSIEKLIGDAIIAVFHPDKELSHPAIRAVNAGLAMRHALEELNRKREKQKTFTLSNGVGIHYGQIIMGKVGKAADRCDVFAIGQTLQTSSRLEALSKNGKASRVIVSEKVAELIHEQFDLLPISGDEQTGFELNPKRFS